VYVVFVLAIENFSATFESGNIAETIRVNHLVSMSAEEKHASEGRKRKSMIASLQQQKKQKLTELKAEAAAIDSKIASLESGICPSNCCNSTAT